MKDYPERRGGGWREIRLTVYRGTNGKGLAVVVERTFSGEDRWDRRMHFVELEWPQGGTADREALTALRTGLEALEERTRQS